MASYESGKAAACEWIRRVFAPGATILDVGACDGNWANRLPEYGAIDAVEIYPPNAERIRDLYRNVYNVDIYDFAYDWYDLIIFGDVIEHMTVEKAQSVLRYARKRCHNMIVAVPFLYAQDAIYENEFERHLQPDLTKEIFAERYPGFRPLLEFSNYAYYVKEE